MFEYTNTGYKEAIKFLKETDNTHLIDKELSIDGYTIVSLANDIIKRNFDGGEIDSTELDRITVNTSCGCKTQKSKCK